VLGFLGFANFYRRFIRDFSRIAAPLYGLVKKDTAYNWSSETDQAFQRLKQAFVQAPVLAQFDPDHETVLETDSSGYCSGGVLSQVKGDVLRPVAFFSKKHSPAECNYPIYDKELLISHHSLFRRMGGGAQECRAVYSPNGPQEPGILLNGPQTVRKANALAADT
jgi:hypothetical protein